MDKKTQERALKALEREKKRYEKQNNWIQENRERLNIIVPLGTKERIKKAGFSSVNGYINDLIQKDLEKREND